MQIIKNVGEYRVIYDDKLIRTKDGYNLEYGFHVQKLITIGISFYITIKSFVADGEDIDELHYLKMKLLTYLIKLFIPINILLLMPYVNKQGTSTKIIRISIYDENKVDIFRSLFECNQVCGTVNSQILTCCRRNAKAGRLQFRVKDWYFTFPDNKLP